MITSLYALGRFLVAAGVAGLLLISQVAHAAGARLELTDGSVLIGEVVDYRDDKVTLKTAFSDAVEVDSKLIKKLVSTDAIVLMLDNKSVIEVETLTVDEGELQLPGGRAMPLETVAIANPEPWERGRGYKWDGNSGAGVAINRGNQETDELDLVVNSTFTSTRDRFTVRGNIEQDDTYNRVSVDNGDGTTSTVEQKIPTADKWAVVGKYDYFLANPDNYFGINASVEADALANIDLRTYIGPYYGRKLIRESWLTLDGELGFAQVNTDFAVDEDDEYLGVNWNFTGESNILGGDSRLYLTHVGILNTDEVERTILNTTVGLAFPLAYGFEAATEIRLDYDGGAAEGNENLDQTYSFRIGYSW